jgi:hypothetical protein
MINMGNAIHSLSRWLNGLMSGSAAARLLGLGVRNPMGDGCLFLMCCLLLGRGLYVGLRSPTECGVSESDREASVIRRPWLARGVMPLKNIDFIYIYIYIYIYIRVGCFV